MVRGKGRGAFFTSLEWFLDLCQKRLGFDPFPGTLNVRIPPEALPAIRCLDEAPGTALPPPDAAWCAARAFPAEVGGIRAALILPDKAVRIHGADTLEFVSPVGLKMALNLKDGDAVFVRIFSPEPGASSVAAPQDPGSPCKGKP